MIRYELARDINDQVRDIIRRLEMEHIDESRVVWIRSKGSSSRRIIARCHALPKIMQLALQCDPHYVIEVISERFDGLKNEEQIKVLIHELMHIPHSFGGGFRAHRPYVTPRKVDKMYRKFIGTK
jgi:predicted metallopeptidase